MDVDSGRPVAIVTGSSSPAGRGLARGLASWAWPVVAVYLEDQPRAEATVAEIIAAGGTTVAVRADLADELDVERLFTESIAAFGGVDVVVHTTTGNAALLYEQAAQFVVARGAIVSTVAAEPMASRIASEVGRRGITVGRVPADQVLAFLAGWRDETPG